jgi:hypothetical protein
MVLTQDVLSDRQGPQVQRFGFSILALRLGIETGLIAKVCNCEILLNSQMFGR